MRRIARCAFAVALLAGAVLPQLGAQEAPPSLVGEMQPIPALGSRYSFVVLGHLRGEREGPNQKLREVMERVRELHPAFAVLTGDLIWGDIYNDPIDPASLRRQWSYLDSALATLGIPVYRVPGNHDISDLVSRDVYRERYGLPPHVVTSGDSRFLLLSSSWIPADGDTRHNAYIRTTDLDETQKAWLREELAKPGYAHTFVFMHHLLWWAADSSAWWRNTHELFAKAHVDGVFSGDYGPMKFSHLERDGVRYFQTSIEDTVPRALQHGMPSSRFLSAQFDNFLEVKVDGPSVDVRVRTVAETSTPQFTPETYRIISAPPDPVPLTTWLVTVVGRKRLAVLALLLGLSFVVGVVVGRSTIRLR